MFCNTFFNPQSFAETFASKFRHTVACRASKDMASLYGKLKIKKNHYKCYKIKL
jgi:hypothetical protein